MERIRVSFIITTLNEAESILNFLKSVSLQIRQPDEIIFTDAGSSDGTTEIIEKWAKNNNRVKIIKEEQINIAEGRNIAITNAQYEYIAVSDAGCILDNNWLKHLLEPFENDKNIDIVGGWYYMTINTAFQSALVKIIEIPLNKIDGRNFLPSSRSIAFKKKCWLKVGGYPENLKKAAEDTLFDLKLKRAGCKFFFQPKAFVTWIIPNNHKKLFKKFYYYAYGDGEIINRLIYYLFLGIFFIILLVIPILSIYVPWLFFIYFVIVLIYSSLPLFRKKIQISSIKIGELLYLCSCRVVILIASFLGFYSGLLSKRVNKSNF